VWRDANGLFECPSGNAKAGEVCQQLDADARRNFPSRTLVRKEAACVATSGPSLGRKRPRRAAIARTLPHTLSKTIAISGSSHLNGSRTDTKVYGAHPNRVHGVTRESPPTSPMRLKALPAADVGAASCNCRDTVPRVHPCMANDRYWSAVGAQTGHSAGPPRLRGARRIRLHKSAND
jgi:hypothetical protein